MSYKIDNYTVTGELLPPVLPNHKLKGFVSWWNLENGKKVMLGNASAIINTENEYKKKKNF